MIHQRLQQLIGGGRIEISELDRLRSTVRGILLDARETVPAIDRVAEWIESPLAPWVLLVVLGAASVYAIVRWRHSRPRGIATLKIDFPELVEGEFKVILGRSAGARERSRGRGIRTPRRGSRLARAGVHRETQFDRLTPGPWQASVEGDLRAPASGARLLRVSEQIEFEVEADETTAVRITLPTLEVPVEVRVRWDHQPARDIGVCLHDQPASLRYSGQGVARLKLPLGPHRILIGSGDRVVEREFELDEYEPFSLRVDLATSEGVVFKGCPPAVRSYLEGDLGDAARVLERDGQREVASILLAQLHQEQGQTAHAAAALEKAGRIVEAAHLRRSLKDFRGAARLFEAAHELFEAAEMHAAAGDWSAAAALYASLDQWKAAADAYEEAGDQTGLIGALEAQGEFLRAAALATECDDRGRAIRLLQKIGPQDADHPRACELLVFAFEQEGHLDLAAEHLKRRIELLPHHQSAPSLEMHLSELHEELGDPQRALGVLEALRDREPTHPGLAARIETLRKKIVDAHSNSQSFPNHPSHPGATAFVAESRYEIVEAIGSGGMGQVYKAIDRRLGRNVALKRMPENLRDHPGAVSLFLGEAQAAARMNHPNIVTLYDADQENGHFFITMELLDGLPLNRVLLEHGPFDPRDTARLALQACGGLRYAHEQGIIHRDIKTANLFITRNRVLKIMDFGLAKTVEAVRDKAATLIAGTPFYMAPEQSSGRPVDARTDLYALGITLFELATGKVPFCEGDIGFQHRTVTPPDLRDLVPGFPDELARLIAQLLAKDPDERPASAEWTSEALIAYLDASIEQETASDAAANGETPAAGPPVLLV